jgi:capsular exopolysaccharide synthesis family protein
MSLTPKEVVAILRRHVLLIILLTFLGLMGGGISWILLKKFAPKYTAKTYIEVLTPATTDPLIITATMPQKDIAYQFRVSMASLIKQQRTLEELLQRDKIRETEWFKKFDNNIAEAVEDLEDHLGASPQRESTYIIVSMTCGGRKESALIVNEMVDLFISSRRHSARGDIAGKLAELTKQLSGIERDLLRAEDELEDIRRQSGLTGLSSDDQFRNIIHVRMADLEMQQSELNVQMKQYESSLESLQRQAEGPINVQVEHQIENDPIMMGLAQRLVALEAELARKLTKLGENHREIREIEEMMKQVKEARKVRKTAIGEQTRQANIKNMQDYVNAIQNQLDELEKMRKAASEEQRELDRYKALYDQRATIRDELQERRDQIKVQITKYRIMHEDPEAPKVRATSLAPEPLQMSFPQWQIFFPAGTVIGFLFGVALAFLIELLNDLVRSPSDVGKYLHIPLLGMICHSDEDEQLEGVDLCHVVRQAPYSIMSECYRQLRTHLKLSGSDQPAKTLLITSGSAGEGKSCVAVNLATTFVAEDKKVLLIDTNFRRPSLVTMFPKQTSDGTDLGLSNLLTGQCSYSDVIRPSGIEGLEIIDCGPLPANPTELLGNEKMKQLLEDHRDSYDYIILDGPPVLLVSDAKLLAVQTDSTLLIFNASITRRGAAQRTIREIHGINHNRLIGCVLLGVRALKGGYYEQHFRLYEDYQKAQLANVIQ